MDAILMELIDSEKRFGVDEEDAKRYGLTPEIKADVRHTVAKCFSGRRPIQPTSTFDFLSWDAERETLRVLAELRRTITHFRGLAISGSVSATASAIWLVLREACCFRGTLRDDIVPDEGHEYQTLATLLPLFQRASPDIQMERMKIFYRRVLACFFKTIDSTIERHERSDRSTRRKRAREDVTVAKHLFESQ